ncbi:hypothetical protein AURDEDRAFT_57144, partial [Auricularia subglabra TFB-10046 SS5]
LFQICAHVHPRDALQLSRTCKALRGILLDRSSTTAWKRAFYNIGLPKCPVDIAGPHYAAMFFKPTCEVRNATPRLERPS